MGLKEDRAALRAYADRLERSLVELNVAPDALVVGLTAVVNAHAALLVTETLATYTEIIREDVTAPLATGLLRFAEAAPDLAVALRRLPEY